MKLKGKYVCTLEMNFDVDIPKNSEAEAERIKDEFCNEITEEIREAIYENIADEEYCEVIVTQQCCDIDVVKEEYYD